MAFGRILWRQMSLGGIFITLLLREKLGNLAFSLQYGRLTLNQRVEGSSPSAPTSLNSNN